MTRVAWSGILFVIFMASLDNIRDIAQLLEKDRMDYYIIAVEKNGNKQGVFSKQIIANFNPRNKDAIIQSLKEELNKLEKGKATQSFS